MVLVLLTKVIGTETCHRCQNIATVALVQASIMDRFRADRVAYAYMSCLESGPHRSFDDSIHLLMVAPMALLGTDQVRQALASAASEPCVLVVDDDADVLEAVVETFQQLGVRTIGALGLAQARRELVRGLINLVVLDLRLGHSDGLALLTPLSRLRSSPDLILLSGLDSGILRNAEESALALGLRVLGVLEKPFSRQGLFQLMLKWSQRVRARPEQAAEPGVMSERAFACALKSGAVVPYLQPQYRLRDGTLIGFEALARWHDLATGQVMSAAHFAHFLDQPRFRLPVFRAMLTGTLAALSEHDGSAGRLSVSINVPAALFGDDELLDILLEQSDRFAIDASRVVLELTESDYAPLDREQRLGMTRLRVHGFGLSLDDFGVGTASLERLTQLPLTEVKLDAQFLARAVLGESRALELVQLVAGLFASQGLVTVAEGVGNHAQWSLAREMHFDIGQGYYLGKPAPAAQAFAASSVLPFHATA